MSSERKAFEEWASSETRWDLYWSDNINQYMDHQTNAAWLAWKASANRDGYKLVPIQPDNKTIVSIERMVENQIEASGINQDPFRLDGENIYKAMIGVCDD